MTSHRNHNVLCNNCLSVLFVSLENGMENGSYEVHWVVHVVLKMSHQNRLPISTQILRQNLQSPLKIPINIVGAAF